MKVRVKLKREYSYSNYEVIALRAVYKTNKSIFKKKIDIIRIHDGDIFNIQDSFIVQLESLINDGNIEERVCEMVKKDIVERIKEKKHNQNNENKLNKMLRQVEKIKFTFDIDENDI